MAGRRLGCDCSFVQFGGRINKQSAGLLCPRPGLDAPPGHPRIGRLSVTPVGRSSSRFPEPLFSLKCPSVGILSAEAAVRDENHLVYDVVAKTQASKSEPELAVARRDCSSFLL